MTTFVLVHGGWSGAHTFRKVRPLLRAAGHEVFTPSLTGIGERAHLTSPLVNLTTHIHDVVNVVLYEDLTDVTLLGYSYGGLVVTGTLEHIAERIRHLVFLDAFVPAAGDTVAGLAGLTPNRMITLDTAWLVPPPPREFDDPVEADWQNQRRIPHPRGCFTEPVRLARPLEDFSFYPHVHQGHGRHARCTRLEGVLVSRRHGQGCASVAVSGNRNRSHGCKQPA